MKPVYGLILIVAITLLFGAFTEAVLGSNALLGMCSGIALLTIARVIAENIDKKKGTKP